MKKIIGLFLLCIGMFCSIIKSNNLLTALGLPFNTPREDVVNRYRCKIIKVLNTPESAYLSFYWYTFNANEQAERNKAEEIEKRLQSLYETRNMFYKELETRYGQLRQEYLNSSEEEDDDCIFQFEEDAERLLAYECYEELKKAFDADFNKQYRKIFAGGE
jgi:hypothetical protein